MEALQAALTAAVASHQAGDAAMARLGYQRVLTDNPQQPDALRLLGALTLQTGRAEGAVAWMTRALAVDRHTPALLANYGHALDAAGRSGDAALAFAQALALALRARPTWEEVGDLTDLIRRYPLADRAAAAALVAGEPSLSDPIHRESLLFYLSGDQRRYQALAAAVLAQPQRYAVPILHYAYWGMTLQLFRGQAALGDAEVTSRLLFELYAVLIAETVRRYDIPRRLAAFPSRKNFTPEEQSRLLIVSNQVLGDGHQPTADAFDIARRLQDDCGCEVVLVNANTLPSSHEGNFWPAYSFNTADYAGEQVIAAQGGRVRMVSCPPGRFVAGRLHGMLDWIGAYNPDVVVAVGASNILADLLAPVRPVICLPTSSGAPPSLAHMILGYADNETGEGWPEALRARFKPFAFGFATPPAGPALSRKDFGLPPEGALFVTIGNRLDTEADERFLVQVDAVLDRLPDAAWVMAGDVATLARRVATLTHANRVHILGHVDHVRPLFRLCAAYVNPRRQGGGGSAAFALADGLPIVTPPVGDVAAVAGAEFTVGEDRVAARCVELALDASLWAAQSARARARYTQAGDRGAGIARLLKYCEDARRL